MLATFGSQIGDISRKSSDDFGRGSRSSWTHLAALMTVTASVVVVMAVGACVHRPPSPAPSAQEVPAPGSVEGRVLLNEQPVAGPRVYATSEYNFSSIHYGEAATDAN